MGIVQSIARAYDAVVGALAVAAAAIIGLATVLIVVDVTIRTLGFPPPHFTLALVEYGLLYVTMFAAPYLVRERGHVFIDALVSRLPHAMEVACAKAAYLLSIAAALFVAWLSSELFLDALHTGFVDERGVDLPYWLLYLPLPLGFGLVAIEFARYLFGSRLMHRRPTDAEGSV